MKTAPSKTAEYYLGLRYAVSLKELAPEEGGGWVASLPELGSKTFEAVGDSQVEALTNLDEVRLTLIPELIAEGVCLPEPRSEAEKERYSGNIMIRIPPALHGRLAAHAKGANVSINKLATQYLAQGLAADAVVCDVIDQVRFALKEVAGRQAQEVAAEVKQYLGNFHANSYRHDDADYHGLMKVCAREGQHNPQEAVNADDTYVRTA